MALRRGDATSEREIEDQSQPRARDDDPEIIHDYSATGVTGVMIGLSVLAVLLIIFLAQNTDPVPIEFLVWDGEGPLFVIVLVALVAAALTTLAVSGVWRRRRRRYRTERDELERLRRSRS
jgi:uncharacterized integral membrane protein